MKFDPHEESLNFTFPQFLEALQYDRDSFFEKDFDKIDPRKYLYNITENPQLTRKVLIASQIWCIFVSVIGTVGNITTIGSIIYQLTKRRLFSSYPPVRKLQRNISIESISMTSLRKVKSLSSISDYEENIDERKLPNCVFENKNIKKCFSSNSISSVPSDLSSENYYRHESINEILPTDQGTYERNISKSCNMYSKVVKTKVSYSKSALPYHGDTLLLLYLSFADLLYAMINLPITYYVYHIFLNGQLPSKSFCTASTFIRYTIAYAEWLTLGLLAIERCIDLKRPSRAKFFTFWPTTALIGLIWIISILLQLIPLFQNQYIYDFYTLKCDMLRARNGKENAKLYFFTIQAAIPTILMITGCLSIFLQIWKNKRALVKAGLSSESVSKKCKEMWSFVRMTIGLLFLYLVCVIPICIYGIITIFYQGVPLYVGIVIFMFYWVQYGFNFVVYGIYNKNYRTAYKEFLTYIFNLLVKMCSTRKRTDNELQDPKFTKVDSSRRISCIFTASTDQLC